MLGVGALAPHRLALALDVGAHHIGIEFGMELRADGGWAVTQ
jgi:hypothetical protein